jgi:hypothetical protein
MTISDLATLSTAVSGFAVTASLIYLAIQTHQNTRNTRALIHQGAAARTASILLGLMNADNCAAWIACNGGNPTPETVRRRQFAYSCMIAINALEDQYLQHRARLLSEEQYGRVCEEFRGLLSEPGLRAFWADYRQTIVQVAPGFCRYVDSLCTNAPALFANAV